MVKILTLNENGKIEMTEKELQKLLDDTYWDGYYRTNGTAPLTNKRRREIIDRVNAIRKEKL